MTEHDLVIADLADENAHLRACLMLAMEQLADLTCERAVFDVRMRVLLKAAQQPMTREVCDLREDLARYARGQVES